MKKLSLLLSILWLISSCTPIPKSIEYGSGMCVCVLQNEYRGCPTWSRASYVEREGF